MGAPAAVAARNTLFPAMRYIRRLINYERIDSSAGQEPRLQPYRRSDVLCRRKSGLPGSRSAKIRSLRTVPCHHTNHVPLIMTETRRLPTWALGKSARNRLPTTTSDAPAGTTARPAASGPYPDANAEEPRRVTFAPALVISWR